ncbi:MAG: tellurite resistance/C4-dicarboxylate transporter family protein [Mycobacterium sp.]
MRPDAFAAVMATGIVSIAAEDHGYHVISDVLDGLAVAGLAVLVVVAAVGWRRDPLDFADPDVPIRLFTFVAACAVLGARLADHRPVLWVLGATALAAWLLLAPLVAHRMWSHRWTGLRDRAHGAWELASVATSGLAIVAADLALLGVAVGFWVLAIAVYLVMTGLILWRAAHDPTAPEGFEPDNWILMGGVAIATLAGDHIHHAGVDEVRDVTIGTWILATLWIPPLIYLGLRRINRRAGALSFDGVWWAAVFPLGMYSAATYAMAVETGWQPLTTISLVFFWIAFTAWTIVAIAGLLRFRRATVR